VSYEHIQAESQAPEASSLATAFRGHSRCRRHEGTEVRGPGMAGAPGRESEAAGRLDRALKVRPIRPDL